MKEEMKGQTFNFLTRPHYQQMVGKSSVTIKGNLVLVHLVDTVIASESQAKKQKTEETVNDHTYTPSTNAIAHPAFPSRPG